MIRNEDEDNEELRFECRLKINHPRMAASEITDGLQWPPSGPCFSVGTQRRTASGASRSGLYPETMWSHSETIVGSRRFFDIAINFLSRLEFASSFFKSIMETGGKGVLMVYLPGDVNIGAVLNANDLRRIAALDLDLGIEVFPNFPT